MYIRIVSLQSVTYDYVCTIIVTVYISSVIFNVTDILKSYVYHLLNYDYIY